MKIELTAEDMKTQTAFQNKVETFVNSYPKKIKLAVMDHIISVPGFVCPVHSLVKFFRGKGIPMFVDGSHAIGHEPIDMEDLQPDAYFSNFHKWGFSPKSAALLYISDKYLNVVKPVITGNNHGQELSREFFWCGTKDITAFLCVQKGLEYLDSLGFGPIRDYNHNLAVQAVKKIAEIWGTNLLTDDDKCIGFLANVEVPVSDTELNVCMLIAKLMAVNDKCFPIFYKFNGKIYCRISVQIYNVLSDYEFMANKFLKYLNQQKEGKLDELKGDFSTL